MRWSYTRPIRTRCPDRRMCARGGRPKRRSPRWQSGCTQDGRRRRQWLLRRPSAPSVPAAGGSLRLCRRQGRDGGLRRPGCGTPSREGRNCRRPSVCVRRRTGRGDLRQATSAARDGRWTRGTFVWLWHSSRPNSTATVPPTSGSRNRTRP